MVSFTREARLFKLKLWGRLPPQSKKLIRELCPCRGGYRMIGTADQHLPGTETGAAALVRLTMSKFTK